MKKYFLGVFMAFLFLGCSKKDDTPAPPPPPPPPPPSVDKIRGSLNASAAAYDLAAANSWVQVTDLEYNNMLTVVTGSAKYGIPEIFMNTSTSGGWSPDYTIGGNGNWTNLPPASWVVGWSVKTGNGISSSEGSKLKVGTSKTDGYVDYGTALPSIGDIGVNTRVYFVLKKPAAATGSTVGYLAIYNHLTFFLGNVTSSGSGPELYAAGDSPVLSLSFASDSFLQVISTTDKPY
jgi:hypothetical protein